MEMSLDTRPLSGNNPTHVPESCSSVLEPTHYKMIKKQKKRGKPKICNFNVKNSDKKIHIKTLKFYNVLVQYPTNYEKIIDLIVVKYPSNYGTIKNIKKISK